MELYGVEYLERKLNQKKQRVNLRYKFYEMKNTTRNLGIAVPNEIAKLNTVLGWCAKSVDSLADRLVFKEFENDNFDLNTIFRMNNPDTFFDSVVLSAPLSSCCFVYVSPDEEGYPRLQVIDGADATGVLDPITGLLHEGYAVLERDKYNNTDLDAYFTSEETRYRRKSTGEEWSVENPAPYALLVPIIHRPDARREFGHSRISRACMELQGAAVRTIMRSEIAAEFYSYPQKYATGISEDAEVLDSWKAAVSTMLTFTKDDDGDKPTLGQFTQQSMTPYAEQLRMLASLFAAETGLTLDDLGFPTDNPSSAEAIKAAHENLRLAARKAQRSFGSGLLNVGYIAACLRDEYPYKRRQVYLTKPVWEPIFEPDMAMLSSMGDGALKINQAVPGYFGARNLRNLTGIEENGDD